MPSSAQNISAQGSGHFEFVLKARAFRRAVNYSKSIASLQIAKNLSFVSGHRFSDAVSSRIKCPFRGWVGGIPLFSTPLSRCGNAFFNPTRHSAQHILAALTPIRYN
jgi:hypothetical protein